MKLISIARNSTSRFVAKTIFSIATLLLLVLAVGSRAFAGNARLASSAGPLDDPIFSDATVSAGLHEMGYTFGGPIWGDFDNDGDIDFFVDNQYNAAPYLYLNNGDGTFTDIYPNSGLSLFGDRHGSGWVDFDNDGDLDLSWIKGASGGQNLGHKKDELYLNRGGGKFKNVARRAGVTNTFGRGRGVAIADYNHDGFLDLLVGNFRTDIVLYANNGDRTFTDVTAQAGLTGLQYSECSFADYDNDGFPDIFCTVFYLNVSRKDILLKNNGDGTFSNVSSQAGIQPLNDGRTLAWGDYDNDGDLDLFISRGSDNGAFKQTLYRNNGDGTFTEVTDEAGLGALGDNREADWGDFNNDGYLDLYVVNSGNDTEGKGPNQLYRNNQDGTFTDVAAATGVDNLVFNRGRCAAWGDYDNDGFLDLFITDGEDNTAFPEGPQFLFHNEGNGNNWLKISLVGRTSNRQGLGATVTIQTGSTIQYREANGAMGHFLSQGAGPLHFGLGQATLVDQITVKWPSGVSQVLSNIAADQEITVTEGQ